MLTPDTGGKFIACVIDTVGNLPLMLIPVVNLDFQISQQIFNKMWDDSDDIHDKNLEQKISWTIPLNEKTSLTLIRMTKDEKGLAFFKGFLL